MFSRLFLVLALFAAAASAARHAPAPSAAPAAASFWNIETETNAEVLAEAATGAPEPRVPMKSTPSSTAAAPAPSKRSRRPRQSTAEDELDADAELDAVAVAADAFAQIAAGAQEIDAVMADADDAATLPTFLEIHEDAAAPEAAVPVTAAVAPHGLVAVGDDAIFAAANSAASSAAAASMLESPSELADLEAAFEGAAMTGNPLVVIDDESSEAVPVAGEKGEAREWGEGVELRSESRNSI